MLKLISGLHYKHIAIVNDDSGVIKLIPHVLASPTIVIMMAPEAPTIIILMTLEHICSTGVTYNRHLRSP
jgi:hypothetical protein